MRPMSCSDDGSDYLLWTLVRDVFYALVVVCVLHAAHRIAGGVLLGARITALREVGEAYTPEEREVLIHKIKDGSLTR
jgi:hypothetical protein